MAVNKYQLKKTGTEIIAEGVSSLKSTAITSNNVVPIMAMITAASIVLVHNFIVHGYGVDVEKENGGVKVSVKSKE